MKRIPAGILRVLWVAAIALALQACGYHLRGGMEPLSSLPPIMVVGSESSALNSQVRQTLTDMKTLVVDDKSMAVLVLTLSSEEKLRRILSVNTSGKAEEYELIYSFTYGVTDQKGKVLLDKQVVRRIQAIQFDATQVNSIVSEAAQLFRDMRRAAVRDLARQLQRFSDIQAQEAAG